MVRTINIQIQKHPIQKHPKTSTVGLTARRSTVQNAASAEKLSFGNWANSGSKFLLLLIRLKKQKMPPIDLFRHTSPPRAANLGEAKKCYVYVDAPPGAWVVGHL